MKLQWNYRLQTFLAVTTKRKSEMTPYLNNDYDVMNYFAKFEKFINLDPRAIMPFSSRDSTASYGPGSYPIVELLWLANEITKELSKFNQELH